MALEDGIKAVAATMRAEDLEFAAAILGSLGTAYKNMARFKQAIVLL